MCLIHLVHNRRSVFYKFPDGIYVIVRDEQQVFRPWTKEDLIFERHDHQLIKLQEENKEKGVQFKDMPPLQSDKTTFSLPNFLHLSSTNAVDSRFGHKNEHLRVDLFRGLTTLKTLINFKPLNPKIWPGKILET